MDMVKGRAVSRTATGYDSVAAVVEAVVALSGCASGSDATALKSYVKYLERTSKAVLDPKSFVSPVSIARYAALLADASVPAKDLNPAERNVAFNAMDRTVHRRPGYAFALARSSTRISKYEYMSGENLMPWFQGDGSGGSQVSVNSYKLVGDAGQMFGPYFGADAEALYNAAAAR